MTLSAQLLRGGQPVPAGPIPIGPEGTALRLHVPAGWELTDAELRLTLPGDDPTIDLLAGALVATDRGALGDQPVRWISLDWRHRRPLVRLGVTLAPGADATHLRVRLSDGGPWILASPGPLIELKTEGNVRTADVLLPGLAASRVLLELVTKAPTALSPEDHPFAAASAVAALALAGGRRPPALSVRCGEDLLRHEPALLPPGVAVDVPLFAALRDRLSGADGGVVDLLLEAPAESALQRVELALRARPIVSAFQGAELDGAELPPGPALRAEVPAGGVLSARLGLVAAPTRVSLRARGHARDLYRLPVPAFPAAPRRGHRCTSTSALAQRVDLPPGEDLVGVDLCLGPRRPRLRGVVGVHLDDAGAPREPPVAAVQLDLADLPGAGVAPAPLRVALDLPAPAPLPGGRCWISLTLAEGEAIWFFGQGPPGASPPLRRERAEPWVPRDMSFATGIATPWACVEPRLRRGRPPEAPRFALAWASEVPFVPDPSGRAELAGAALPAAPDPPTDAPLRVLARCSFAARVELDELAAELPEQPFHLSFGT